MATEPIAEEIAGVCVDSHGSAIGMPQLCADWIPNQVFWLIITLVVIFFVLSRIASLTNENESVDLPVPCDMKPKPLLGPPNSPPGSPVS